MTKETAMKILKELHDNSLFSNRIALETLIPELAESNDERIRKALIRFHKSTIDIDGIKGDRIVAWLEKQDKVDTASYEVAENEKREFVGDGFIKCYADFQDFKEGETYWLEYVGKDNYNVRSDNLLGKTYHITPCQLYTIFKKQTWIEKQGEQKPILDFKANNWHVSKVDGKIHDMTYNSTDRAEPKFKVGDWITIKE